jgi:hypothetical protein
MRLALQLCNATHFSQRFLFDPQGGKLRWLRSQQYVVQPSARVLRSGNRVHLWREINGNLMQNWRVASPSTEPRPPMTIQIRLRLVEDFCMTVERNLGSALPVVVRRCNAENPNQLFRFLADGTLRAAGDSGDLRFCVSTERNSTRAQARLQLALCLGPSATQRWRLLGGNLVGLVGQPLVMALAGHAVNSGNRVHLMPVRRGSYAQRWSLVSPRAEPNAPDVNLRLRFSNDFCATVLGAVQNNTAVELGRCDGSNSQRFRVLYDRSVRFAGNANDLRWCLDVASGAVSNGTALRLVRCAHPTPTQRWLYSATDGSLRMESRPSMVMTLNGGRVHAGNRLSVWNYVAGSLSQQWLVQRASSAQGGPPVRNIRYALDQRYCMTLSGRRAANFATMSLAPCNVNNTMQRWRLYSDRSIRFAGNRNDMSWCVTLHNDLRQNGSLVELRRCLARNAVTQRWTLERNGAISYFHAPRFLLDTGEIAPERSPRVILWGRRRWEAPVTIYKRFVESWVVTSLDAEPDNKLRTLMAVEEERTRSQNRLRVAETEKQLADARAKVLSEAAGKEQAREELTKRQGEEESKRRERFDDAQRLSTQVDEGWQKMTDQHNEQTQKVRAAQASVRSIEADRRDAQQAANEARNKLQEAQRASADLQSKINASKSQQLDEVGRAKLAGLQESEENVKKRVQQLQRDSDFQRSAADRAQMELEDARRKMTEQQRRARLTQQALQQAQLRRDANRQVLAQNETVAGRARTLQMDSLRRTQELEKARAEQLVRVALEEAQKARESQTQEMNSKDRDRVRRQEEAVKASASAVVNVTSSTRIQSRTEDDGIVDRAIQDFLARTRGNRGPNSVQSQGSHQRTTTVQNLNDVTMHVRSGPVSSRPVVIRQNQAGSPSDTPRNVRDPQLQLRNGNSANVTVQGQRVVRQDGP